MNTTFTEYYFILFGLLSIAFGIIGFVRAKSKASLIAGSISGILLLAAGCLILCYKMPIPGFWMGGIVSLLLIGKFLPTFLKTKHFYPAGVFGILSVIGVVLSALALFG